MKTISPRLKAAGSVALVGAAGMALTLAAAAPAGAATSSSITKRCLVQHELYQQPVAAIIALAEVPDETCHIGNISLVVFRNGVRVAAISGGPALSYRYDCITTEPTVWSTNWDPPQTFNCG